MTAANPDGRAPARAECPVHLVPLRTAGCWACACGMEPQALCLRHGRYPRTRRECPTCVLRAMFDAGRRP